MGKKNNSNLKLSDKAIVQIIDVLQYGLLKQVDITDKFRDLEYSVDKDELVPIKELELYDETDF